MHAHPYRKIFASYSHKDLGIVRQFEVFVARLVTSSCGIGPI